MALTGALPKAQPNMTLSTTATILQGFTLKAFGIDQGIMAPKVAETVRATVITDRHLAATKQTLDNNKSHYRTLENMAAHLSKIPKPNLYDHNIQTLLKSIEENKKRQTELSQQTKSAIEQLATTRKTVAADPIPTNSLLNPTAQGTLTTLHSTSIELHQDADAHAKNTIYLLTDARELYQKAREALSEKERSTIPSLEQAMFGSKSAAKPQQGGTASTFDSDTPRPE